MIFLAFDDGVSNMGTQLTPKSVLARDKILSWIQSGRFLPGQQLPSEQSIGEELGISHITVRVGLKELSKAGLIHKRSRVGNFVAEISNRHLATYISIIFPDYMSSSMDITHHGESGGDFSPERMAYHPVPGVVTSGVYQVLSQRKYSISQLFYKPSRFWLDSGSVAAEREAKGVILWPHASIKPQEVEKMLDAGIKMVMMCDAPNLRHIGLFYIERDEAMALGQILDKFLKLGHRKIATLRYTARPDSEVLDSVISHYYNSAGIKNFEKLIFNIPNRKFKPDYSVFDDVFDLDGDFPTAVVVPDEHAAWELFCRCYKRNVRIPDDLSVASLANSSPHVFPVMLSSPDSIALNYRAAGLAAKNLSRLLDGEELIERCTHLRCDVKFTKSVGAPRKRRFSVIQANKF